ncbi:hypothetical protein BH20ACT6_BH20ACT6_17990 [soil metagenome]
MNRTGHAGAFIGRVVDEAWDPPVTLAVRVVNVLDDGIQPTGKAAS